MAKTPPEKPAAAAAARPPLWKRPFVALAARGPSLAMLGLFLGNGLIGVLVVYLVFFHGRGRIDVDATIAEALQALDNLDHYRAGALAEALEAPGVLPARRRGATNFIFGVIAAREAAENFEPQQHEFYALAVRRLGDAREQGFPAEREGQGLHELGHCLAELHRFAESRLALEAALASGPPSRAETLRLLAETLLAHDPPEADAALARNGELLAEGGIEPAERQVALLQRARILLKLGRGAEIAELLAEIPAKSALAPQAHAILASARQGAAAQQRAAAGEAPLSEETKKLFSEAIALYRQALSGSTLPREMARQAHLAIGQCLEAQGDIPAALAQYVRARRLHPQTAEGVAANLYEARLTLASKNYPDALSALARGVQAAGDPGAYYNPWFTLEQFRALLLATYDELISAGHYALAVQLSESMEPIVPHDRCLELAALARRSWGQSLRQQAELATSGDAAQLRAEAAEHLRKAGVAFAELAAARTTERSYVDHLWASAECLMAGRDYSAAKTMLEKYLREESRRRRPLALVSLGEALLAEGHPQEALAEFAECLESFPRDAMAFRARLLSSATYLELGNLEEAEAQIMALLNSDQLTPSSQEWREGLFSLGRLLYLEGRYEEAFARLDEAVARYPDLPATLEARFLAAEAYRLRAWQLRDAINVDTPETQRQEDLKRSQQMLEASLGRHAALQERLLELLERQQLATDERALLRNSYFSRGAVLMSLARWDEAIRIYTTLTNRYPRDPEVLDAYVQIARCYRRLNQPLEARASLEQAKVTLARIEEGTDFEATTNYSRAEWSDMLAWMSTL